MIKTAISVESSADVPAELALKYDIKIIPYQITLGEQVFRDGEKSPEEMFEFVDRYKTLPKTTALNEFEYTEFFESLKRDYDAVIHICLSGGITSSCDNAFRAAEKLKNVFVVDSRSLSMGTGYLAIIARELIGKGASPEETVGKLKEAVKKDITAFVVERLDYLHKGGRCSSIALLGANLLKIRPRIIMKDGKMVSDKKYRGNMAKVISDFVGDLTDEFPPSDDTVCIAYTTATDEMIAAATDKCKAAGFKNVIMTRAGATISSHCGANTLGVFYITE
ncbi:MAG: DegV family protein [Clostridia bacterium]|nr:DegV family protein [Clostridia bacterium]